MMEKKIIITLLLLLTLPAVSMAQTDEKKSEIAKIKKSSSYLFAEATMATAEVAHEYAEELLYNEINSWVATQKKLRGASEIIVKDSKSAMQEIALPRGNMFRAFCYVKKSDIIVAENSTVLQNEASTNHDLTSTVEEVVYDEQDTQVIIPEQPDVIKKVVKVEKFSELRDLVTSMKQSGDITEYDLYSNLSDASAWYLVVCSRQQDVVAVLTPADPTRYNLKTNLEDSVYNYDWHGATIALKLK